MRKESDRYAIYKHFDSKGNLKCRKCKKYKKESEFCRNKKLPGRHFRHSQCKKCMYAVPRKKYEKKVIKDLDYFLHILFLGFVNRCKNQDRYKIFEPFNITEDFLKYLYNKQKGKCALSGIEMTFILGKGKVHTNISIDRKNPKRGYIKKNIRLVCSHVNMMRSNLSDSELYNFCNAIIENYGQ